MRVTMKGRLAVLAVLVLVAAAAFAVPKKPDAKPAETFVGSDKCLSCHFKFAKTWPQFPHTRKMGAEHGCESCHGPGSKHVTTDRSAITKFYELSPSQKDAICLKCHAGKVTAENWKKSSHARQEMSCTLCHDMHNPSNPAKMLRARFDKGCLCHSQVREEAAQGKHHKLPEGIACTSCHSPHGSPNPSGLLKPKSELCKNCHGGNSGMPQSHSAADWKKTHGKTEDRSSCATCHGAQNTCTTCHGGVEMPHASGWMMNHKDKGASFSAGAPCFKCHDKKEFCSRCHADKT